jgi:hypothetical protein
LLSLKLIFSCEFVVYGFLFWAWIKNAKLSLCCWWFVAVFFMFVNCIGIFLCVFEVVLMFVEKERTENGILIFEFHFNLQFWLNFDFLKL